MSETSTDRIRRELERKEELRIKKRLPMPPFRGHALVGVKPPEVKERELLIERIEGIAGTLKTVPYSLISTEDLIKLYYALIRRE